MFILHSTGVSIYLLVYADNIIITGNNPSVVHHVITLLSRRFSLKDLGALTYFLGIEVLPHLLSLILSQRLHIVDLLARTAMTDARQISTPLSTISTLSLQSSTTLSNPFEFRIIVGNLQYLLITRLDIVYAVNKLSQFMHRPTGDHWNAVKRILRYLCGTIDHGLTIHRHSPLHLHAYCDADWVGNKDDFTSTGTFIIYLGRNPIFWSSKKQRIVARSSTEAKYCSFAATVADLCWICNLLGKLGYSSAQTLVIYYDNVGATNLCSNPVFHSCMKHVALDYHFIRKQVQNDDLRVPHVAFAD